MDTSVDSLSSVNTGFEALSAHIDTLYPDLSTIHQEHIQNANSTIQNLLSSLRQINADITAAREEIPADPYEKLKREYCLEETEPIDFELIKVPEDFCYKRAYQALMKISQNHSENFAAHIEVASLSGFNPIDHPHFGNAFAKNVDGKFELNKSKITNHFQFLDMVKKVPLDYIKANPKEFSEKVLTKFIEIYQ